jgi:predicted DNA-binding transcriptional regulator AlpA
MGGLQWASVVEVARKQLGVVSLEQLRHTCGVSRSALAHAVERGHVERMFPSAYRLPGGVSDWRQRAFAATLVAGEGSALSHHTAAAIYGLAGFEKYTTPIHVSMPSRRGLSLPGPFVIHRPLHPFLVCQHRRMPTTSIARTLVDLAGVVGEEALEIALDDAHHKFKELGLQLEGVLGRISPRYAGVAALRELIRVRRGLNTESALEVKVWRALRKAELDPPRLQLEVHHDGRFIMRVDFAWPVHRVALHVDSFYWHSRRQAFDTDARQRSQLAALGWVNVFATERSLRDPAWFEDLRRLVRERSPQLALELSSPHKPRFP